MKLTEFSRDERAPLLRDNDDHQQQASETEDVEQGRVRQRARLFHIISIGVAALASTAIILSITAIVLSVQNRSSKLCLSPTCVQVSSSILEDMDGTVDPCDDFFQFTCGNWLKNTDIPRERGAYQKIIEAQDRIERTLKNIIETPLVNASAVDVENFAKVVGTYEACMNENRHQALGREPIAAIIRDIQRLYPEDSDDDNDLLAVLLYMQSLEVGALLTWDVDADSKNPDENVVSLYQPLQNGLPSKEYYDDEVIVESYIKAIAEMFGRVLDDGKNHTLAVRDLVRFEAAITKAGLDPEDLYDETKTYNPIRITELDSIFTHLSFTQFLRRIVPGTAIPDTVIVSSPKYLKELDSIIADASTSTIYNYFIWKVIEQLADHLDADLREPLERFGKRLDGKDPNLSEDRWKICVREIDSTIGFLAGRYFVLHEFPPEAKIEAHDVIDRLKAAFVDNLPTWMDQDTQRATKNKVDNIFVKVGYNDASPNITDPVDLQRYYADLLVDNSDYFGNYVRYRQFSVKRTWESLGKPVDRDRWLMTPMTWNAYYNPPGNEICFPAGILMLPTFSTQMPDYLNFGGLGSVAGHELTHAFDSTGRHFDENGRLVDWWTNDTVAAFMKREECFIDQYSAFHITDPNGKELHINGRLTEGENLADNG